VSLNVRIRPNAKTDIDDHAFYLTVNANLAVAQAFLKAVHESANLLATQPELGERLPPTSQHAMEFRRWAIRGFREHLIVYRVTGKTLEVVRVLHAKRDIIEISL
jgi:plasmid stabilization system protein ParE